MFTYFFISNRAMILGYFKVVMHLLIYIYGVLLIKINLFYKLFYYVLRHETDPRSYKGSDFPFRSCYKRRLYFISLRYTFLTFKDYLTFFFHFRCLASLYSILKIKIKTGQVRVEPRL